METSEKNTTQGSENVFIADKFVAERTDENLITVTRKDRSKCELDVYVFNSSELEELTSIDTEVNENTSAFIRQMKKHVTYIISFLF